VERSKERSGQMEIECHQTFFLEFSSHIHLQNQIYVSVSKINLCLSFFDSFLNFTKTCKYTTLDAYSIAHTTMTKASGDFRRNFKPTSKQMLNEFNSNSVVSKNN
jgi:uncharacterized membrane protein